MKLFVTLVHVAALLALAGSTLGDGDNEADSPRICSLKEEKGKGMDDTLTDLTWRCLDTDGTVVQHFYDLTVTLEGHKTFFKNLCDKRSQIRECLAGVEQQSKVCLNQTSHNTAQIARDLLATILDSVCVQDGEVIASMYTLYTDSRSGPFESDRFRDCVLHNFETFGMFARSLEISSRFFMLYREFVNNENCFGYIAEGDLHTSTSMKSIISDITKKMKCIHPQDGTPVLCTTIDITLPDIPRICPIKPLNEDNTILYEVFTDRLMWCLGHYSPGETIHDIETIDNSRVFLKNLCGKKLVIGRCWSDTIALSSACMNETEHNGVTIVENTLHHAYDYGCIEDGRYLAYVLLKVSSNIKNSSIEGHDNYIQECTAVADRAFTRVAERFDAAAMLVYYQQINVFKGCLIDKLRGDNDLVFIAESVLTLVVRSIKCIDPLHDTVVLCETIDTTPSTKSKVCPFVGEKENERPKNEIFISRAFMCVRASTLDFRRMDAFTTLKEFQTFFNSFCHNRRDVTHCVDALSSNSAVCQNETNHQMLGIFTDFLESTLEIGCQQDGEPFAIVAQGLMGDAAESGLANCFESAGKRLKNTSSTSDSLSAKSVLIFREFETMKECVLNENYEVGYKNVFTTFANDVLRSFKCVHPGDGTTVLCETIVNN